MGTDGQQGSRRRSIDSRAADPTKSAAADDDGGSFRRRPRKRKSSIVNNEAHLKSEIPAEEVEETIMFLQSCGSAFRGFEQVEINVLSEAMSVMRFDAGQTVVEQGETGSWFGVLLSGTLRVLLPNNVTITMQPGAIVGEMAVWKEDAIRSASMVGGEGGIIATMLRAELPQFVSDCPETGVKLMRMMAESAVAKQSQNLRRDRASRMSAPVTWHGAGSDTRLLVTASSSLDRAALAIADPIRS